MRGGENATQPGFFLDGISQARCYYSRVRQAWRPRAVAAQARVTGHDATRGPEPDR